MPKHTEGVRWNFMRIEDSLLIRLISLIYNMLHQYHVIRNYMWTEFMIKSFIIQPKNIHTCTRLRGTGLNYGFQFSVCML